MKFFIKVCGITSLKDASEVCLAGADAIGLMLYEKSPRHISLDLAVKIYNKINLDLRVVLVFVNAKEEFVKECFDLMPNAIAQFHGNETEAYCSSFGKDYIKAIALKDKIDLDCVDNYPTAKMILLDSFDPVLLGGTGITFNWDLITADIKLPYLLAGGLTSKNIKSALDKVSCAGVDVSSGVESEPGIKDNIKVNEFINKVRSLGE